MGSVTSDPLPSELVETVQLLRELQAKATPGPYRAHDHNDMARLGEDPEKWMGYAWVGRITKQSEPDGRFDAGWLDRDSRKDASKEYRERASVDAHFVAEALNALPALLDLIERLTSAPAGWQLVPIEATDEMLDAVARKWIGDVDTVQQLRRNLAEDWLSMLSTAPSPSPVARVPDRELARRVFIEVAREDGENHAADSLESGTAQDDDGHRTILNAMVRFAALFSASPSGGWQPIETAPKDGTHVLLWDGFAVFEGFNNWSFDGQQRHDNWCTVGPSPRPHVTVWQPLPNPPSDSSETSGDDVGGGR